MEYSFGQWQRVSQGRYNLERRGVVVGTQAEIAERKSPRNQANQIELRYPNNLGSVVHIITTSKPPLFNQNMVGASLSLDNTDRFIEYTQDPIQPKPNVSFISSSARLELIVKYHPQQLSADLESLQFSYRSQRDSALLESQSTEYLIGQINQLYKIYGNNIFYPDLIAPEAGTKADQLQSQMDSIVAKHIEDTTKNWDPDIRDRIFSKFSFIQQLLVEELIPSAKGDDRFLNNLISSALIYVNPDLDVKNESEWLNEIMDSIKRSVIGCIEDVNNRVEPKLDDLVIFKKRRSLRYRSSNPESGVVIDFPIVGQLGQNIEYEGQIYRLIDSGSDYYQIIYGRINKDLDGLIIPKTINRSWIETALSSPDPRLGQEVIQKYRRFFLNQ